MLRSTSIAILLLAGAAVLCILLTLRIVVTLLFALSGVRRPAVGRQLLTW